MSASRTLRRNLERLAVWLLAAGIAVLVAAVVGLIPLPDVAGLGPL